MLSHSCCFHPKRLGQMRAGSLASGHMAAGNQARGQRQHSQQQRRACIVAQPSPSAEGPRLAHAMGDEGRCSRRMGKWGWGRCSVAGAEILGYLQNCDQSKIHWLCWFLPFFQRLYLSGVVSEKMSLPSREYRHEMIMPLLKSSCFT